MARKPRPLLVGYPVHIIQRGNDRKACFFADEDYQFFRDSLAEFAPRFKCALHAYVLMTNHTHLLLTPEIPEGPSLLMKFLGQRYVQYINKTYRRTGTLWEGRFRLGVVQSEQYVLACYRYIELNPVRANMVEHPADYRWSSYGANGAGAPVPWLTPHDQYVALGRTGNERLLAYQSLFNSALNPEVLRQIRNAGHYGRAVGNSRFQEEIAYAQSRRAKPTTGRQDQFAKA